jgi:predicted RNA binding protein YcfA (HicA-like mRNA interferase family)
MTKQKKIAERYKRNPTTTSFREIEIILRQCGFITVPTKGSHPKFKHPILSIDIIVPIHNGECKKFYKLEIASILTKNKLL